MKEFKVGDRVIYKNNEAPGANAVVSSTTGCPPGQVIITLEGSGVFGMVPTSELTASNKQPNAKD